jgi:hypothetical protein
MAIVLLVIGGLFISIYSWRSYRAYQQWQYIQEEGIDKGYANVGAIRAWMTMRYVSVAYAVPQEYIFDKLNIQFNRQNSNKTIRVLTEKYQFKSQGENNNVSDFIVKVGDIINTYRLHPIASGLKDIRPWMTLQYIANSTGIPIETLFSQLNITADNDNEFIPLKDLASETDFKGGISSLIDSINDILSRDSGNQ